MIQLNILRNGYLCLLLCSYFANIGINISLIFHILNSVINFSFFFFFFFFEKKKLVHVLALLMQILGPVPTQKGNFLTLFSAYPSVFY